MGRFIFSQEHLDFLQENFQHMTTSELTKAFNKHFKTNKTFKSISSALKNHKIKSRKAPVRRLLVYTKEQLDFLKKYYPHYNLPDLVSLFNKHFNENKSQNQIRSVLRNHKITSGRTGKFQKGHTAWNKNKKGFMGPNKTSFKPGHTPSTTKPLYHERVDRDGYILIKVPETNPYTGAAHRFKYKHVWLWEQNYGAIPEGHIVMFKDGDIRNFDLNNLMLVSRSEQLIANLHDYKYQPSEIKPTILALAKVEAKAGFRLIPGRNKSRINYEIRKSKD